MWNDTSKEFIKNFEKNINFNDFLVYTEGIEPCMNNYLIENKIYELNEKNKAIFNKFKQQSKLGLYPSVKIVHEKDQWFLVKAFGHIKKNTLIYEYTGDMFFSRNKMFSKNDFMDLIIALISDISLVIYPEKNCNLARFLSGTNNKKSSTNQNVYSQKSPSTAHTCVTHCKKNICKDELLYYDNKAGDYNNYNKLYSILF